MEKNVGISAYGRALLVIVIRSHGSNRMNLKSLHKPLAGVEGAPRGHCETCGIYLRSEPAYRVPGLAGHYCSIECIETVLFGTERCRWCGTRMEKLYAGLQSRLCSEDCRENYQPVISKGVRLGDGKRLVLWLQRNQPEAYRALAGKQRLPTGERICQNPNCTRGDDHEPARLDHLRAGAKYCNHICRMAGKRASQPVLDSQNRPLEAA